MFVYNISSPPQVGQFVQEKLSPQFGSVIEASSGLRNSVSQGAKHFSCVSLAALDCRVMKGSEMFIFLSALVGFKCLCAVYWLCVAKQLKMLKSG